MASVSAFDGPCDLTLSIH